MWCTRAEGRHLCEDGIHDQSFKHESAEPADAEPRAFPGTVLVLPSEIEVEQHEVTHLACRSWCRHCLRAKRKESPRHESRPCGVSKIAIDHMFMGEMALRSQSQLVTTG